MIFIMVVCRRSIDLGSIQIKFVIISYLYLLYTTRQAYTVNILLFNLVAIFFFLFMCRLFFFLLYISQMFSFDGR